MARQISNNGGKMQSSQTKQAIMVENVTVNQIRRRDNKQERRRKKEKKSVIKVNVRDHRKK
eukprot:1817737-Ditylum_brightwellii.AAC.1